MRRNYGKAALARQEQFSAMGPAMSKLTEKQRAFVLALREVPPNNLGKPCQLEAMRRAGYQGSEPTLRTQGSHMMQLPHIQAAIKEVAFGLMSSEGIGLTAMLLQIAYGQIPATPSERMKAAQMIFNRVGMPERTETKITVEHTVSNDEAVQELYRFARILDVPAEKLLGSMGVKIIDGEFQELERDEEEPEADTVRPLLVDGRADISGGDNSDALCTDEHDPFAFDGDEQQPDQSAR